MITTVIKVPEWAIVKLRNLNFTDSEIKIIYSTFIEEAIRVNYGRCEEHFNEWIEHPDFKTDLKFIL
jgi:hypothetical protein